MYHLQLKLETFGVEPMYVSTNSFIHRCWCFEGNGEIKLVFLYRTCQVSGYENPVSTSTHGMTCRMGTTSEPEPGICPVRPNLDLLRLMLEGLPPRYRSIAKQWGGGGEGPGNDVNTSAHRS